MTISNSIRYLFHSLKNGGLHTLLDEDIPHNDGAKIRDSVEISKILAKKVLTTIVFWIAASIFLFIAPVLAIKKQKLRAEYPPSADYSKISSGV